VAGVPSSELKMAALSRGSAEGLAGEQSSLSPRSLYAVSSLRPGATCTRSYLSTSLVAREVVVFLRFGAGMRHSIEKAVQLVHGMPNEAASQRTCVAVMHCCGDTLRGYPDYLLSWHGML
jgi:hypothetical protein